jgi:hypothetical protein
MMQESRPREGGHPATGTGLQESSPSLPPDEVERILAELRAYQEAARAIVQDDMLAYRAKCAALVELQRRARREEVIPAFYEAAIWGWARTILQPDPDFPGDKVQAAIRRPGSRTRTL